MSPKPKDVFQEFKWIANGNCAGAIRVASKACAKKYFPGRNSANKNFTIPGNVNKSNALKAEINVQKVLCHSETYDLEIQINDSGNWHKLGYGLKSTIPDDTYQHMIYPSIKIPLDEIRDGQNQIQFRVSDKGWCPQNLIYGAILRIYTTAHPAGKIISDETITSTHTKLSIDDINIFTGPQIADIIQVDYIYKGLGVNWEGDGDFTQWHYHFFQDKIMHHIGSASQAPWSIEWNNEWIPTQRDGIEICARIVCSNGMVYMTDSISVLLQRINHSVELAIPQNVPAQWVTRTGVKSENFDIKNHPSTAKAIKVCWSSWGDYCGALMLNNKTPMYNITKTTGECEYSHRFHEVNIPHTYAIVQGKNRLMLDRGGHHGMEVNWPGLMVLVQHNIDDTKLEI